MNDTVTLFLEALEFYAFHGVSDEERAIGHRYRIDLAFGVRCEATETDDVVDTVDYGDVAQAVVTFGRQSQFRTVERLAAQLGDALLSRYERMEWVRVRVAKRLPPAPVVADLAGVELIRRRVGIERETPQIA